MALHKLVFDTSDAASIAASANVGAYLRASDGTLITHTGGALDVNFSATDLDIRDLDASQDNVAISDGTDTLEVNADGSINITDNGGSLTVDATDLDIRDLSASQDNVAISDGTDTMAVNADGSINSVVTATDFDIRDLTAASDSVEAWAHDGTGNALTSTTGHLDINIASSDIEIDVEDDLADTAIASSSESVSTTGTLFTTDLANRRFIWLYNNGNKTVFIGPSGVASGTGFPLFPGSMLEARIGPSVAVHAVSDSGTQDIRTLQAS